jgi:hypothetical protein
MQRYLRSQHTWCQQHTTGYLQMARDRDLGEIWRDLFRALTRLPPYTARLNGVDSTDALDKPSRPTSRYLCMQHSSHEQGATSYCQIARDRDLGEIWRDLCRAPTRLPPYTARLNGVDSTAAHAAPCSPKRWHLRGQHAQHQQYTPT